MKDFSFTFFSWILTLPVLAALIAFCLFNAESVDVVFNPFRGGVAIPLYIPVVTAVAFGFVFGSLMTWAAGGRERKERRDLKHKVKSLEKENTRLQTEIDRSTQKISPQPTLISANAYDYVQ